MRQLFALTLVLGVPAASWAASTEPASPEASSAGATRVSGTLSTVVADRRIPQAGDIQSAVPVYELLSLEVQSDETRLVLSGWGRLQLGEDELHDTTADLALMYLETYKRGVTVRLGRQHLVPSVARMDLVDGLDVRWEVEKGFSGEGFVGLTVNPELRHQTDSLEAGGRLAFNLVELGHVGEVGVGYIRRWDRGDLAREELGADLYTLVGPARLSASAASTVDFKQLVEARAALSYQPLAGLEVTLDAERVAPALFIPRTSIFTVFADAPHDELGGDVSYAPSPYWRFDASGAWLRLDDASLGYRARVGVATFREASHRSVIGAEAERLDEAENGYIRGRLYTGLQLLPLLKIAADLYGYRFDTAVNAIRNSGIVQLSAIYDFAPELRVAATVAGGATPWAKSQVEAMLRLSWGYDYDFGREATR